MSEGVVAIGPRRGEERLARGLGWFSVGLGLAQLTAPRALAKLIGLWSGSSRVRTVMRALGARELGSGIGLLARPRAGWLWARFAGDLVDLTLIGRAFSMSRTNRRRLATAFVAVLEAMLLDLAAGRRARRGERLLEGIAPRLTRESAAVITIGRPPEEVYRFWRELRNLPLFMTHLEEVQELDERRSHFRAKGFEWDAELTVEEPNRRLSWRTIGGEVAHQGNVRFSRSPDGKGTEVRVEVTYEVPATAAGVAIAKLLGKVPAEKLKADLRRLKQLLEVGEVVHSDASIHRGLHAARPASEEERERGR